MKAHEVVKTTNVWAESSVYIGICGYERVFPTMKAPEGSIADAEP